MRHYPDPINPALRIPFYERREIERITWDELSTTGQATDEPGPVCMETFCMRRYRVGFDYTELPDDVCGEIVFSLKGVEKIRLRREFGESISRGWYLMGRTTAAHETGHAILHASEIVPELAAPGATYRHRCGAGDIEAEYERMGSFTRHRALEWQANAAMGCLLLPRPAVLRALETSTTSGIPAVVRSEGLGFCRDLLAETFDTSRDVALYRMLNLFPELADAADAAAHSRRAA